MADLALAMTHKFEATPEMDTGSAVHTLVLEPDKFGDEFAVAMKVDGRTAEGKAYKEKFAAECNGRTVLNSEQMKTAMAMADRLRSCEMLTKMLAKDGGLVEAAVQWTDEETGVLCKGRMDWCLPTFTPPIIIDLKTTSSAHPRKFAKSIGDFGYHVQAAMYSDAIEQITGQAPVFLFYCVESCPPFKVRSFYLSDRALYLGRIKYRDLLSQYQRCVDTGEWPGYPEEPEEIDLPAWAD